MTYPQLVDHKNCSLLKPERRDFMQLVETRGFDLSPLFASGAVYTSSVLDMLLCQVGRKA